MITPIQFFKCLADETRLRCLMLIQQEGELCVCELTEALQEIQPKISRHLAQLRKCGILVDRRQGQWIFYRINADLPQWAKAIFNEVTSQNSEFLDPNTTNLKRMGGRPERVKSCC
ncbi:metalloregulator ArsR/SmtB family transcription factor [Shewanella litoralis]|uniref:Transcriptional regulator n=1 Tax=Shewanella litoralis TaxID=2282700 RepID=A0ABQ2RAY9_9GAMM|nr:metalloregulator ArsR/SmtB family transcription factor [Shewanella litoralis]GGQ17728.1 transcriptional regulator [Shewanella litoralis]